MKKQEVIKWNMLVDNTPRKIKGYYYLGGSVFEPEKPFFEKMKLEEDLGSGNIIRVSASYDMFSPEVSNDWITAVLKKCRKHPKNGYIFHTVFLDRFMKFKKYLPEKIMISTTIESNRMDFVTMRGFPKPEERLEILSNLKYSKIIYLNPLNRFDTKIFVEKLKACNPAKVFIDVNLNSKDTKRENKVKIGQLIFELEQFVQQVKIGKTLKKILSNKLTPNQIRDIKLSINVFKRNLKSGTYKVKDVIFKYEGEQYQMNEYHLHTDYGKEIVEFLMDDACITFDGIITNEILETSFYHQSIEDYNKMMGGFISVSY